jgi:peptide/nickel transport system substrate-binding protein
MIQEQLRKVGIEARPRVVEFNAMMSTLFDRDFEAGLSAWAMPTSLDMRYAFHTSEIGDGGNFSGYSNPEVDRLVERMENLSDIADAKPILIRLQEILHQDQPLTFLWESQRINGMNSRLRDVRPNVLGTFRNADSWWLAPTEE